MNAAIEDGVYSTMLQCGLLQCVAVWSVAPCCSVVATIGGVQLTVTHCNTRNNVYMFQDWDLLAELLAPSKKD